LQGADIYIHEAEQDHLAEAAIEKIASPT